MAAVEPKIERDCILISVHFDFFNGLIFKLDVSHAAKLLTKTEICFLVFNDIYFYVLSE